MTLEAIRRFFGRNAFECRHLINFQSRTGGGKVKVEGIEFEVNLDTKLIRGATHALILYDAYQYHLCISIRNLTEENQRNKYTQQLIDLQLKMKYIIERLMDPPSEVTQNDLSDFIISNRDEVLKIEKIQSQVPKNENISFKNILLEMNDEWYEKGNSLRKSQEYN